MRATCRLGLCRIYREQRPENALNPENRMNPQLVAASYAMSTAVVFATFSVCIRKGGEHANALTGVFIGLFTSLPVMLAVTWYYWQPEWWNLASVFLLLAGGPHRACDVARFPLLSASPTWASRAPCRSSR